MATAFPISEACSDKGAQGELLASAWLLGLGFQVFRNVSPAGPADLVAWHPATGSTHLIDVKTVAESTVYAREDGSLVFSIKAGRPDVHKLVLVSGKVIGFCRSVDRRQELYWPLPCPQPDDPPSISVRPYKETRMFSRGNPREPSKALKGAWQ